MKNKLLHSLCTLGAALTGMIWGSTFFITKKCLDSVDPITLTSYRFLLSAVFIFGFLLVTKRNPLQQWRHGLILGLVLLCSYFGQVIGLSYVSASSSGFISGLFVVFVPVLSFIFWGKKLSWHIAIAVGISLLGLWIITGGIHQFGIGDWWTLAGALFYGLYVLLVDKFLRQDSDTWVLNFQQFLVMGVVSFIIALCAHSSLQVGSVTAIYFLLYLAIFASILAFGLQLIVQKYLSPMNISLLLSLEPVFAAIFAWSLGGEQFKLSSGIGGLFVVFAIIFSQLSMVLKAKKARKIQKEH